MRESIARLPRHIHLVRSQLQAAVFTRGLIVRCSHSPVALVDGFTWPSHAAAAEAAHLASAPAAQRAPHSHPAQPTRTGPRLRSQADVPQAPAAQLPGSLAPSLPWSLGPCLQQTPPPAGRRRRLPRPAAVVCSISACPVPLHRAQHRTRSEDSRHFIGSHLRWSCPRIAARLSLVIVTPPEPCIVSGSTVLYLRVPGLHPLPSKVEDPPPASARSGSRVARHLPQFAPRPPRSSLALHLTPRSRCAWSQLALARQTPAPPSAMSRAPMRPSFAESIVTPPSMCP
jgi:hypothetical protein